MTSERAALILYDDTHLFCLTTSKAGELQFPSAPIELGLTAQESAIRAFNTYAGPALNKYEDKMTGVALMPNSSRQIRVGLETMTEVGTYGHTVYLQEKKYLHSLTCDRPLWLPAFLIMGFDSLLRSRRDIPISSFVNMRWPRSSQPTTSKPSRHYSLFPTQPLCLNTVGPKLMAN